MTGGRWMRGVAGLLQTGVLLAVAAAFSAALAADRTAQAIAEVRPVTASISSTAWSALSAAQQLALAPLQKEWASIDGVRQQKWLELTARFPTMPADERSRIQQRMAQWASLTPAKRNQVRLQFLEAKQLPAEQRQARWQEYQALSVDEKQAWARQARQPAAAASAAERAPARAVARANDKSDGKSDVKSGQGKENLVQAPSPATTRSIAATTLQAKPGATTRPLNTPAAPPAHHQPGLPKIVATEGFVDPATLLPKRGPQGAAVRSALTSPPAAKP